MKILFLDQFSQMGGAQRGLLETLEAADGRGWQALVAIPPGGPLVDKLRARNLPVIDIPCGPYESGTKTIVDVFRFGTDLRAQTRILRDLVNRGRFDLIYVNGPRLLPAAALAAGRHAAVLFHAHSHIPQPSALKLAGWSVRRANAAVVACSNSVLDPFRPYVAQASVSVISNGVGEIQFRERTFARETSWRIGVIGRISPEKGQAEFVQAAALLQHQVPNVKFFVCGAPLFADPAYLDSVQTLARGLPVEFLGWRDDVASVLAELDLLVVPSQQEGMGRVVVEAFSAGVPVIAFSSGGIPEVIVDGENGFLVPEKSPQALAARIGSIIAAKPESLHRIAANARRSWEQSYSLPVYQSRIAGFMEQHVSDWRARRGIAPPLSSR